MELKIYTKEFSQLTRNELYEILRLRSEVFVVEQNCVYQDIDNQDQESLHLLGYKNKKLITYARVYKNEKALHHASIGRVIVKKTERGNNYGYQVMENAIMICNIHFKANLVSVSAQEHLAQFYTNLGFMQKGKGYFEDGIPHIFMVRNG